MPIDVTLGTQEIQILDATTGDLIDTIAYQSIDTITYVNNPGTVVVSSTLGAAPTVTGDPQWSLLLWLRDGRKSVIELGNVSNQSGWTNDQTGFDQAVADIYAAFPTGGGGGGGVTSVGIDPGDSGFGVSNSPITTSGDIELTGYANVRVGATLFVDDTYGDDGTGTPNRANLPYATIQAAMAAAQETDLIYVRCGSYAEALDDTGVVNNLNFYFAPGASTESLTLNAAAGTWRIVGGVFEEGITLNVGLGTVLYLDNVQVNDLECSNVIDGVFAIACRITDDVIATAGGSIYMDGCIVSGATVCDAGTVYSHSSTHTNDVTITNGGVVQGGGGSTVGGIVTDDPVTGDFFRSTPSSEGNVSTLNADGTWSWAAVTLRYKWLGDGGAATGTEIVNTLGETINVTNPGVGIYRFTAASGTPFTTGKTTVVITPITTTTNLAAVVASMTDTEIEINIFDTVAQTLADPTQYMVVIEVEP